MDISINERLKQFVENEKISCPVLYKKIGIHRSIWSGWMNQGKAISVDKLVALLKAVPSLNAGWLMTGEGNIQANEKNNLAENEFNTNDKNKETPSECSNCVLKDNEVSALKIALDAKEELLEMYRGKKENRNANSA